MILHWSFTFFFFFFFSSGQSSNIISTSSVDSIIRDSAFKDLALYRTNVTYQLDLPANLSGASASAMKMRSKTFWRVGMNMSAILIPPGVLTVPHVKRFVIVCQDLGNWSATYFNVPGYTLLPPVISFLAYDATNMSSNTTMGLGLNVTGGPITVSFPKVRLSSTGMNSTRKCVRFGRRRSVYIEAMATAYTCSTRNTGHFAIAIPTAMAPTVVAPVPPEGVGEGRLVGWRVWVIACGFGAVGLVMVGLVVVGIYKVARSNEMEEMEGKGEEDEALDIVLIGDYHMPSASFARTKPIIETEKVLHE